MLLFTKRGSSALNIQTKLLKTDVPYGNDSTCPRMLKKA